MTKPDTFAALDLPTLLDIPELPSYLKRVERGLGDALPADNPFIRDPALRLMKTGGKRLRPALVLVTAGKTSDKVIRASIAVELLHLASLIHDDFIDQADSRWNVATISRQEGSSAALLVGDYLLAKAAEQAACVSAEVAQTLAAALADMCDGQGREMADQYSPDRTIESYLQAIDGKTAALIAASCQIGGLCGELPDDQIGALASFGRTFGLSFQLIDDVLDVLADPQLTGKPIEGDIKAGVYTMPILLSLQQPSGNPIKPWLQKGGQTSNKTIALTLLENGSIEKTILEAMRYNQEAASILANINGMRHLAELPDRYLRWALQQQTAVDYKLAVAKILASH